MGLYLSDNECFYTLKNTLFFKIVQLFAETMAQIIYPPKTVADRKEQHIYFISQFPD